MFKAEVISLFHNAAVKVETKNEPGTNQNRARLFYQYLNSNELFLKFSYSSLYDSCSNGFLHTKQVIEAALKAVAEPELKSFVIHRIMKKSKDRLICGERCPLCGSCCILPKSHSSSQQHRADHGIKRLAHVHGPQLPESSPPMKCNESCIGLTRRKGQFLFNKQLYSMTQFETVFPDWMPPASTSSVSVNVREAVFYSLFQNDSNFRSKISSCKFCNETSPAIELGHDLKKLRSQSQADSRGVEVKAKLTLT